MKRERKLGNVRLVRIAYLWLIAMLLGVMAFGPIPAYAQPSLLGWVIPFGLVSIDPVTGASTLIINSDRHIEGLAFDSIGKVLYGVDNLVGDNVLVIIDVNTGTISVVGPVGFNEITGMTFDELTNTIFALDQTTRTLLRIDPATGAGTAIGNFGFAAANGLAAQPTTGNLFASVFVDPGFLARIDKTTAASTLVGSTGSVGVTALEFHPVSGVLFGSAQFADGGSQLVTLDLTTGLATPVVALNNGNLTALAFVDITVTVAIDVKPGGFPNSINPKSKGVIPVAILTTPTFDATTVDPLSVRFGPNGAVEAHGRGHLEDADGDGDLDLVLHFRTQDTGIQCGDTSAALTGDTFSEQIIQGSDSIMTVGCR